LLQSEEGVRVFLQSRLASPSRARLEALTYSAVKAAVIQPTRCVAVELGEKGIRSNSNSPEGLIADRSFSKSNARFAELNSMLQ
jgi:NAD(P)-dependent dehydrogenase (short-subunit alcohol dehydrogenase family)